MKKRIITLVLSLILVLGSLNVVLAGYAESEGQFVPYNPSTAYYDAYCNYSSGSASTHLYVDSTVTAAYAYVKMDMYIIDKYFYEHITDAATLDSLKVFFYSGSDSSETIYDSRVLTDVEVYGANYTSGEQTFHGYRVISDHSASITRGSATDGSSDRLVADY